MEQLTVNNVSLTEIMREGELNYFLCQLPFCCADHATHAYKSFCNRNLKYSVAGR